MRSSPLSVPAVPEGAWARGRTARLLTSRHPEWWLHVVAGLAWLVLLARSGMPEAVWTHAVAGHHVASPGGGQVDRGAVVGHPANGLHHWPLMVLAMMLPVAAPQARLVALRSLWPRRHRSAVLFVAGYLAVWLALGVGVVMPLAVLGATSAPAWAAPALVALAALWHLAPPRRRLLRRCGSLRLRAADGRAADRNCALVGVRSGARCVASCGPAMLPMALHPGSGTGIVLMAVVLAVMLDERADGPNPATRAGHPRQAAALVAVAGLVALPSVLG